MGILATNKIVNIAKKKFDYFNIKKAYFIVNDTYDLCPDLDIIAKRTLLCTTWSEWEESMYNLKKQFED